MIQRILLATDGSAPAERAAEFLCALSLPHRAEVTVISVAESRDIIVEGTAPGGHHGIAEIVEVWQQAFLEAGQTHADQAVERLRDRGFQVQRASRIGLPANEILRAAQEQDADLIIVDARGRTRAGPFRMGDVAQKAAKYASCSVLMVR